MDKKLMLAHLKEVLSDGDYNRAVENIKAFCEKKKIEFDAFVNKKFKYPYTAILCGFSFADSIEGYEYWIDVCKGIRVSTIDILVKSDLREA